MLFSRDEETAEETLGRKRSKSRIEMTSSRTAMIKKSSLRPVLRLTDLLRSTSSARLIPSGVSSNAQARITATGNPSAITATKTFIVHGGASKVGNKIDAACSNNH